MNRFYIPFLSFLLCGLVACESSNDGVPEPYGAVPSEDQLAWYDMEMNAFIHFTINTFTDKEWGYGDESPELFNPSELDTDQWMSVLEETGFSGTILTAKPSWCFAVRMVPLKPVSSKTDIH